MMDPKEILEFWFGKDPEKLTNQALWFKLDNKKLALIEEKFSDILTGAENNELSSWCSEVKSKLALVILLSQMTRFIHWGKVEMFSNDTEALRLATELIKDTTEFNRFTCIEKYFVYFVLLNVEDLKLAKQGLNGIEALENECLPEQKEQFSKLFKTSMDTYKTLLDFGRFPQRNGILERLPTLKEIEFLKKQPIYKRSYLQPLRTKAAHKQPKSKAEASEPPKVLQRILFLHGFRQNSNKIKKRLGYLLNALKVECNAHVTFLNGTLPYQECAGQDSNNEALKNPIESQRVWYNPSSDFTIYHGIDEAYAHILTHIKSSPTYDGIIGFSQGGVMASMIAKRNPDLFNYFILISSYKPRCLKYAQLLSPEQPVKCPSLHISGKSDEMVLPERSEDLARCFEASTSVQHVFGHFAPNAWPLQEICKFVSKQAGNLRPPVFIKSDGLAANILKLNMSLARFKFEDLNLASLFEASDLIKSDEFKSFFDQKNVQVFDQNVFQDKVLIAYILLNIKTSSDDESACNLVGNLWLRIYSQYREEFLAESILEKCFLAGSHWKELVNLCDLAYQNQLTDLYEMLVETLAEQIVSDLSLYDRRKGQNVVAEWTSIHQDETAWQKTRRRLNELSDLALYLPRIKNAIDKRSRIGREIARRLNSYKDDDPERIDNLKIESYNKYRKIVSLLSKYVRQSDQSDNPRQYSFLARHDKVAMELLMKAPLSDSIVNPVPEPVDIASREQMQPLYDWLSARVRIDDDDLRFLRGVVTRDGRLDLCKQVIGPMGIEPLLEALASSQQVDRVLLGNNVIGDDGGQVIADFIKSGKSTIKIWYIAGNKFTGAGIKPIAEALENDTFVTGLWLKRNPLKMPGMIPISNLLTNNKTLQVLDLLNCGLLDEGVSVLFKDLHLNTTLKHIYLSANGITPVGLRAIRDYFRKCNSQLVSLFLGCNRIGNEGAAIVADIIRAESRLSRLNLASCRIGAAGMKHLSEALIERDAIRTLDLGYMRSTMDLGELGNYVEDEGAEYLSEYIRKSNRLASLNINHNHISELGMQMLMSAVRANRSLVELEYVQYGVSLDSINASELKKSLERNQKLFVEDCSQQELDDVKIPEHVREIYSVYRTH